MYLQGFQSETNHYSHWVSPRRGKALVQEILFKVQVAGLKLESIPNRAQYKHLETESPTNSANPRLILSIIEKWNYVREIECFFSRQKKDKATNHCYFDKERKPNARLLQ